MSATKPSLELLRSLSDEHVLRALIDECRLTRAEIATRSGISKPTVSESVRRLTEAGVVRDTGERTTGRGRVGTYYALAPDLGNALVVAIAPGGVVAEAVDVHGQVVAREVERLRRPADPTGVRRALRAAVGRAIATGSAPARLAVASAADPVDRASGALVQLPDAPFLVGELPARELLSPFVDGPTLVDNDVNWAARAERAASPEVLVDFAFLHLGEGLGCAIVSDGEVRRGHGGLAGEIAHVLTRGPGGRATPFTDVFSLLHLRRPGTTAVDVDPLLALLQGTTARDRRASKALVEATSGVVAALVALTDPAIIVTGGDWGSHPLFVRALTEAVAQTPRPVPVRSTRVNQVPSLAGARQQAIHDLRAALLTRPRGPREAPSHTTAH